MSYIQYHFSDCEKNLISKYFPHHSLIRRQGTDAFEHGYAPFQDFEHRLGLMCRELTSRCDFSVELNMSSQAFVAKNVLGSTNIWAYYCALNKELAK